MPAYKLKQLGNIVESLLFEEFLSGNQNWVPDYTIKRLAFNRRHILEKEDTWRRVADDVVRMGRIKKMKGKAMYKHRYCPSVQMKAKSIQR